MKLNLRWQLLLAFVCLALVLSLLSYQVQSASLCAVTVPSAGGTFIEGMVGAPHALNPLLSDGYPIDTALTELIFDGLTRVDDNGQLAPDLADSWTVAEDGLSVRFHLQEGRVWQDGEPVTAVDVAFTYGLLQDGNFPGAQALKTLWQAVTINVIDEQTVEFVLAEPYSPFLEATTRGILPAHRLQGVTAVTLASAPFNQAPIGTGPFMVSGNGNWQTTHRLHLVPNPASWQTNPPQINDFEFRFYPDEASLLTAFAHGEIHAMNRVSAESLPEVLALPNARLFTAAEPRYTALFFNLFASDSPTYALEVRQALAAALDRPALIDAVLNGQALPLDGPYLPTSWAYDPSAFTTVTGQPAQTAVLLDKAGWLLPTDGTLRFKEEKSLTIRLLALDTPLQHALAENLAGQWAAVGVATESTFVALADLPARLAERAFDVALLEINPPSDPDVYDFWSQDAILHGQNYAGWNNRRASEALESGRQVWPLAERRPFYNTFVHLYNNDLPALTLYQPTTTYVLSSAVNKAEMGLLHNGRDKYKTLPDWFLLYRDVTVSCPATPTVNP